MNFSSRTLSISTVVVIVGMLGGGVYWKLRPASETDGTAQASEPNDEIAEVVNSASQQFATDIPQPVTGASVVLDTLWITVTAAGEAEAYQRTTVTARVEGIINGVRVRENQGVSRGRTLVQIDTTDFALAVARARSDMRSAEADYRQLVLFDDEIADADARAERDRVARSRSGLEQAQVALREAELDLERTRVGAPFNGRVADLLVVAGQFVNAGAELMTVVDLDPIKVEVQVLEAELGYLSEGRGAQMTFAAFPGETFRGNVETINPVVDPETRTGRVTVLLSNPEGRIKPGMYATVSLDAQSFPDRILVPRQAILERDRRTMLFVFEDGRAKWRYVTTGLESDQLVEIVLGDEGMVEPGETVLVDGHHYLVHDASVRVVESVASEGGRPTR